MFDGGDHFNSRVYLNDCVLLEPEIGAVPELIATARAAARRRLFLGEACGGGWVATRNVIWYDVDVARDRISVPHASAEWVSKIVIGVEFAP